MEWLEVLFVFAAKLIVTKPLVAWLTSKPLPDVLTIEDKDNPYAYRKTGP